MTRVFSRSKFLTHFPFGRLLLSHFYLSSLTSKYWRKTQKEGFSILQRWYPLSICSLSHVICPSLSISPRMDPLSLSFSVYLSRHVQISAQKKAKSKRGRSQKKGGGGKGWSLIWPPQGSFTQLLPLRAVIHFSSLVHFDIVVILLLQNEIEQEGRREKGHAEDIDMSVFLSGTFTAMFHCLLNKTVLLKKNIHGMGLHSKGLRTARYVCFMKSLGILIFSHVLIWWGR